MFNDDFESLAELTDLAVRMKIDAVFVLNS